MTVLVQNLRKTPQRIVGVLHRGVVGEILLYDPPERVALKLLHPVPLIPVTDRKTGGTVADFQKGENVFAVPLFDPRHKPRIVVGQAGRDPERIRIRDHPVEIVVAKLDRLSERVADVDRIAETVVADHPFPPPVVDHVRLARPVVDNPGRTHRFPIPVQQTDLPRPSTGNIGKTKNGVRRPLIRSALLHQNGIAARIILKVDVVFRHVPDSRHVAAELVVTVADNHTFPAVHNLTHLAVVGNIVTHEIVNRVFPPGEIRQLENPHRRIKVIRRTPIHPVRQTHLSRKS